LGIRVETRHPRQRALHVAARHPTFGKHLITVEDHRDAKDVPILQLRPPDDIDYLHAPPAERGDGMAHRLVTQRAVRPRIYHDRGITIVRVATLSQRRLQPANRRAKMSPAKRCHEQPDVLYSCALV
jgi:hypothetical protein